MERSRYRRLDYWDISESFPATPRPIVRGVQIMEALAAIIPRRQATLF